MTIELIQILQKNTQFVNIKDYVYNYRKEHGLSMEAFGKKCGLSRAYISILEKGINPTTGKAFIPTIDTLKRIADSTGADLDSLLKMLDDDQVVVVNRVPSLELTEKEIEHIKKYRQLDAGGQDRIDRQIDFELFQLAQSAEAKEERLG